MPSRFVSLFGVLAILHGFADQVSAADTPRPNVLFIALDDLNAWIGCLGGHPQALTPRLGTIISPKRKPKIPFRELSTRKNAP